MKKISQINLRKFIQQEVKKVVDEDAVFSPPSLGSSPYYAKSVGLDVPDEEDRSDLDTSVMCRTCGSSHVGEVCPGPDYIDYGDMLAEGCGCGGSKEDIKPLAGYEDSIAAIVPDHIGHSMHKHDSKHEHDKGSSYMARPQLAKIAKYSNELLSMIGHGEEIQDWQESKIAQMSQMISDVYHSIEYKKEDEDLF